MEPGVRTGRTGRSSPSAPAACASWRNTGRLSAGARARPSTTWRPSARAGVLGLALHPLVRGQSLRVSRLHRTAPRRRARESRGALPRGGRERWASAIVLVDRIAAADIHDGALVRFGPDGYAVRDDGRRGRRRRSPRTSRRSTARFCASTTTGGVPADNPFGSFVNSVRTPQPAGPRLAPAVGRAVGRSSTAQTGNDELNRITRGSNYGWPVIEADQTRAGMEAPVLFFNPAIAPSGASFYPPGCGLSPASATTLFVATLRGQHLHARAFRPRPTRERVSERRSGCSRTASAASATSSADRTARSTSARTTGTDAGRRLHDDDRVIRIVQLREPRFILIRAPIRCPARA